MSEASSQATTIPGHATVSSLTARGVRVRVRGSLLGQSVTGRNKTRCQMMDRNAATLVIPAQAGTHASQWEPNRYPHSGDLPSSKPCLGSRLRGNDGLCVIAVPTRGHA